MSQNKCRCCFFSDGIIHLSTIVQNAEGAHQTYQEIFEICSGFVVTPSEPQVICYSCADLMRQAHRFLELTKKTQQLLAESPQKLVVFVDPINSEAKVKTELPSDFSEDLNSRDHFEADINSRESFEADEYIKTENIDSETPLRAKRTRTVAQLDEPLEPFFFSSLQEEIVQRSLRPKKTQPKEEPTDDADEPLFFDNTQKYPCPFCLKQETGKQKGRPRKEMYRKYDLNKHVRTSHPEAPTFNCSWCTRSFYFEDQHISHLEKCTKRPNRYKREKRIICPYCAKMVSNQEYKKHIKYHVEGPPPLFECDLCDSRHQFKTSLIQHIETKHLGILPEARFSCTHCDKVFRQHERLKDHLLGDHQLGEKLKCQICDYTTHVPKNLRRHVNRHYNVRKNVCEVCGFRADGTDKLKAHMTSHSDAKNFVCTECGARYKNKASLFQHNYIHQGVTYVCPVCQQTFKNRRSHRDHIKKKHPGHPVPYSTKQPNIMTGARLAIKPLPSFPTL